jgi:23S rRNA pseudouridine2605 synthase
MKERVQKIIAQSGLCSRRKAEELIIQNRVTINNKPCTIGDSADNNIDIIKVDNKPITKENFVYYMLHKPKDYITTSSDMYNRKTVLDLVPKNPRVFAIGRLDRDTSGLLLLTNDGDFANKIMHPSNEIIKTYLVTLKTPFNKKDINKAKKGIYLDTTKVTANIISITNNTILISIHVGIHKVVKRLCKELGYYVKNLQRTHIGNLSLDIPVKELRKLTLKDKQEINKKPEFSKEYLLYLEKKFSNNK